MATAQGGAMSELGHWSAPIQKPDMVVWVEQFGGEIIVVAQPDGYDFWNIYDSTDEVVAGRSLGPFKSVKQAVKRIQRDIPDISDE